VLHARHEHDTGDAVKRAQTQVLWVIIELVIVVIATSAIFLLINRAKDNHLSEQQYAVKDLALTRQGMDLYAGANAYYDFVIPGITVTAPTRLGQGIVIVGSGKGMYVFDRALKEIPLTADGVSSVGFQTAANTVTVGADRKATNAYSFGCPPVTITGKIAIIPATADAQAVVQSIVAHNPARLVPDSARVKDTLSDTAFRDATIASADATIVVGIASTPSAIAYVNVKGVALGCALVNTQLPTAKPLDPFTFNAAVIPVAKDYAPANSVSQLLPDGKPGVVLLITVAKPGETSDQLYAALT
jgi:hypothetical protein